MSAEFPHLLAPIRIRNLTLRNRIMMPPHGLTYATHDGLPTDRQAYYYAERAKGGVAMMVWGGNTVHPNSVGLPQRNLMSDERGIPGYKKATDMVHEYGGFLFAQLSHQGRQQSSRFSRLPLWAPSPIPCPLSRETPKEMEAEDFAELLEAYAKSTRNAVESGFDGVELYAAQGYLLSQFLSPTANHRTDRYGGNLENRVRLSLEVLQVVRENIGDRPIGFRMNGDDLLKGGLTVDEACQVAKMVNDSGLADYFSITAGSYINMPLWMAEMSFPPGMFVPLAAAIRQMVTLPVIAVNRVVDPVQAETIIANGQADMVGMVRALIADPHLPNKAAKGDLDAIRPCISCNQGCQGRAFRGQAVSCIHNPAVGFEESHGIDKVLPAAQPKHVAVVGGGPGGLEAAVVAAERGHKVTLFEKSDRLGGQLNYVAKVKSRQAFSSIIEYRQKALRRLGVDVRLSTAATADEIAALNADVVVLATGSTPARTGFTSYLPHRLQMPGAEQENVLTTWDVLSGKVELGDSFLVIDDESDWTATMTAEYLLDLGKQVTIVARHTYVGQDLDSTTLGPQYQRLFSQGVQMIPMTQIDRLEGTTAIGFHTYTKEERRFEADQFVLVMGNQVNDELYHQLKGRVANLHRIGDCLAPRHTIEAIYEGSRLAATL